MLKELKQTSFQDLKENTKAIIQQRGNIKKEVESINKKQMKILQLKSTINKMKNS